MASKKTQTTSNELNEVTKPEVMTGKQYCEAYSDDMAGDLIIRVADGGHSLFVAPKENNSGNGGPLTKAKFKIVDFGGFRALPLPGDLTFDNGRHAGQPVFIGLSMYTLPGLSQLPIDETRAALNEIITACELATDENANKRKAAAEAMLANLDKVIASKAEAAEATKATKPAAVKAA